MKQQLFKILCAILLLGLLIPGGGAPQARGELDRQPAGDFVPGEVLVKFLPGVAPVAVSGGVETGVASLDALVEQYGITAAEPLFAGAVESAQGLERIYKLSLPTTADVLVVAGALGVDAYVEYAEPNFIYHIMEDPDGERLIHGNTPALDLTKMVDDAIPNPGQIITYTITVSNSGAITATAALISDTLPAGLTFAGPITLDPPGAGTPGTAPPTLVSGATITAGQSITVTFPVTVNAGLPSGTVITNTAAVTSTEVATLTTGAQAITIVQPITPSDPLFRYQWGLHNTGQTGGTEDADIDAPEAWSIITGTTGVLISVIDTGVDYTHEDLDDGRVRTDIDKDYVNNDDDAKDDHGHGTHVAGTIAAETNNGLGVAGVMWQAQILPLKVCDSRGSCSGDDVAAAISYAADQGADVINMSLGSLGCSQTIADAINYAYFEKGVVIVAAAGNSGLSIGYPAKHPPVIAVGATDYNDERAYFSSYGDALDVVAPGVTVLSTVPNFGYDSLSGTSMASPHVAGVVGLLLAQRPGLSQGRVREILHQSADDLGESGFDRYYGYGRVNALHALLAATPDEPPSPEQAACPTLPPCAASVALAGEADGESLLSHLRAVRDQVFTKDPGRRWVRIYYEHQFEVAWLLMSDSQLRADALAGLRAFDPVFRAALGDAESDTAVILTPELIEAAERALMGVAERGSPAVRDAIVREWEKVDPYRFVGWDVREVWEQLRLEEKPNRVYLPLVLK